MIVIDPDEDSARIAGETLFVTAAGGIVQATLLAIMASTNAFSARLTGAQEQTEQLSALQMRTLATAIADMTPARYAPPIVDRVDESIVSRTLAAGAPVVT